MKDFGFEALSHLFMTVIAHVLHQRKCLVNNLLCSLSRGIDARCPSRLDC